MGQCFKSLKSIRAANADYEKLLLDDMEFVDDLLNLHCNRETLYLHRRFVIKQILSFNPDKETELRTRETRFVFEYIRLGRDKILIQRHVRWGRARLTWPF